MRYRRRQRERLNGAANSGSSFTGTGGGALGTRTEVERDERGFYDPAHQKQGDSWRNQQPPMTGFSKPLPIAPGQVKRDERPQERYELDPNARMHEVEARERHEMF
jgi:hypothetical protein